MMRKLKEKNFKIFVDFDGTITTRDVGEAMFLIFGDAAEAEAIIKRWINKEITSVESWRLLCATIENYNEKEFFKFLDTIEIDPVFKEFYEYTKEQGYDLYVLSDGLDVYIEYIMKRNGLEDITVYSNKLTFGPGNELIPYFPYTDEECKQCANCKRNHILENSGEDDFTVYIGDGYSDTCPALYVDFIFAKDSLLKHCEVNRITYFPYKNFGNVLDRLKSLESRNRLKKRHQAELKRKEVYLRG